MWLHALQGADLDPRCGGKAVGLARLLAAGLAVPDGFVLDDRAFHHVAGELAIEDPAQVGRALAAAAARIATAALPEALERDVIARARGLGPRLAVRSSATIEDGAAGAAAGVFSSRRAVAPDEVWAAIRAVWTSALTPLAAAYARRRGGAIAIGVIVQAFVDGERLVAYTRPPGAPEADELVLQRGEALARYARGAAPADASNRAVAAAALGAERALAVPGGADVELVQAGGATWIVQARPIVHPVSRALVPPPPAVLAPLAGGRAWAWDVAHNPDPLSVAQAELAEHVERAGIAPWSLRVCAGYLYTAPRAHAPVAIDGVAALASRAAWLEAELERALGDEAPTSVADAVARYLAFYRIWAGELAPLIAAGRAALPEALRRAGEPDPDARAAALLGRRPSAVEAVLDAAARGELDAREVEARLGALAPAWDVAVPTFAERPGLLADAVARAAEVARARPGTAPSKSPASPGAHAGAIAISQLARDLAERDDALFARAQRVVRRALLARAAALGLADDDVFWIPLDDAPIDPVAAHRRAAGARAAAARAATWQMPLVVGGPPAPTAGTALRGVGTGPRVTGRVVRFASLASAIAVGAGEVVVTRAVTPALAVLVAGCAAIVSETGGLLDHGAALARELGVPCVVGCAGAWSRLSDGMIVTVDGDAGTVDAYASSSSP
jgi:pyruvate,water dikinase